MTQKEKELLLIDLCARLPYGVLVMPDGQLTPYQIVDIDFNKEVVIAQYKDEDGDLRGIGCLGFDDFKLLLHSMSSMTEEEKEELRRICDFRIASDDYDCFDRQGIQIIQEINNNAGNHQNLSIDFSDYKDLTDWLNSHHFDYNGLIEKGLALEAQEDMYKIQ